MTTILPDDVKIKRFTWLHPFAEPVTQTQFIWLAVLLGLAFMCEVLAMRQVPVIAWLAPRLWLGLGGLVSAAILGRAARQLVRDIRQRCYLALLVTLALAALLLWPLLDSSRGVIGQDATQQMAAGLDAYGQPDWNFTGRAFLGYPSRQYLLAAWPALLLGRTVIALKIGFAWPFWLGLIHFANGLRAHARANKSRHGDALSLAAVTAVAAFPYVTEYYLYFEHTLYPCCFALQAIGWLLLFFNRPTFFHALALAFTGSILVFCYTPGLAVAALLALVLFLVGWPVRVPRWPLQAHPPAALASLALAVSLLATLGLSLLAGRGDRFALLRSGTPAELWQAALTGLRIALTGKPAVYTAHLLPLVWLYLLSALLFLWGRFQALLAAWILAIFVLSQLLQGYAVYPPPVSFSRTLVSVPVLVTAWFLVACSTSPRPKWLGRFRLPGRWGQVLLVLLVIVNLVVGSAHLTFPLVQGDAAKYYAPGLLQPMHLLVRDINRQAASAGLKADNAFTLILYTDKVWLKNPIVYTRYFYPRASTVVLGSGQGLPDDLNKQQPWLIYILEDAAPDPALFRMAAAESVAIELDRTRSLAAARMLINPQN